MAFIGVFFWGVAWVTLRGVLLPAAGMVFQRAFDCLYRLGFIMAFLCCSSSLQLHGIFLIFKVIVLSGYRDTT